MLTYVTSRFGGGGKNHISHVEMADTANDAAVAAMVAAFEALTTATDGGDVDDEGAHVVSVTNALERIYAGQNRIETDDMTINSPILIAGRAFREATVSGRVIAYSTPWILRGMNPMPDNPSSLSLSGTPSAETIFLAFIKKYIRVNGGAATYVTATKTAKMH